VQEALARPIELAVVDDVGMHELPEAIQERRRKGLVALDGLRRSEESERLAEIGLRQPRHGAVPRI
jgi:hypothetical protein